LARHVVDPQFVATRPDAGHRSRLWHRKQLASLEAPQQESSLESRRKGERRGFDLPVQPGERLVLATHRGQYMS